MCLFLETICIKEGKIQSLDYHIKRMERTFLSFFPKSPLPDIELVKPEIPVSGIYKWRLVYNRTIEVSEFIPYKKREINSFSFAEIDFDYNYKYLDRSSINNYVHRDKPNEEVIFIKNGLVSDTSFTNLAFYDGDNWYTPPEPLLKGTKREKYLNENRIKERKIKKQDLPLYRKFCMFNSMLELEDLVFDVSIIQNEL